MENQEENIIEVNTGRAKEEMLFPFVIAFTLFAAGTMAVYLLLGRKWQILGIIINILGMIILAGLMYFYRDPDREIEAKETDILCPADGKIVGIAEVNNAPGVKGKFTRISIFLNVHSSIK